MIAGWEEESGESFIVQSEIQNIRNNDCSMTRFLPVLVNRLLHLVDFVRIKANAS